MRSIQPRLIDNGMRTQLPHERDELQEAFENYKQLKIEFARIQQENLDLRVENGALVAEVNMLRESLERRESDCIRLQAVASTFTGQAMALNAIVADIMRLAIKNGVDAAAQVTPEEKVELNRAGSEAHDIIERVVPPTVSM